jgi:heterodisulfide reductase subunit A
LVEIGRSPNIKVLTNASFESVEGEAGNFTARVTTAPRYINEDLCTACGICTMYCPVMIADLFNEGFALRRSLHKDYPQAIPASFYIDPKECLYFNHDMCGICVSTCQAQAIDFTQKEETHDLSVGSIILAPGFGRVDEEILGRYGFGIYPDVVTGLEFERLTSAGGADTGGDCQAFGSESSKTDRISSVHRLKRSDVRQWILFFGLLHVCRQRGICGKRTRPGPRYYHILYGHEDSGQGV